MKKIAYISALAFAALGFSACNDCYDLPNPEPQKNPQEEIFKNSNVAIAQAADHTLDLQAALDADKPVVVANITELGYIPEGYALEFVMDVANSADFAQFVPVETYTDTATMTVSVTPTALEGALAENFTRNPENFDIFTRFAAYASNGTSRVRLGADANYYYNGTAPYEFTVDRLAPANVIAQKYVLVGNFCNWDIAQGFVLNPDQPDVDVYDNPVFVGTFDVTEAQAAAGFDWKVVAADATDLESAFGAETPDAMEGALVAAAGQESAGQVTKEGVYLLTVDFDNMSYNIKLALEYLWTPGNGSSSISFGKVLRLGTNNYINYDGVSVLYREWYLTGQAANQGVVFLADGDSKVDETTGQISGNLVQVAKTSDGTKMHIDTKALYYITVNVSRLSYTVDAINRISAIGAYNEWNLDTAKDLTPAKDFLTWEIKDLDLPEGEFKFCVNGAWTLSFGGSFEDIVQNGGNLNVTEAGKYDVKLDFSTLPYTCTLTKK